jgi:hypothetical protein
MAKTEVIKESQQENQPVPPPAPPVEVLSPTKVIPTSAVISLAETQKPFAGPRSMVARSFLTTLEPIQERPAKPVADQVNDEDNDDNEDGVIVQNYNPRLQGPQGGSEKANAISGFADHSAVNDIVSTSFKRQTLLKQGEHHMLDLVNAATNPVTPGHEKTKSVSFSQINQTIDADNTIRKSSVSVAIVKTPVVVDEKKDYLPTPTPAMNIPSVAPTNDEETTVSPPQAVNLPAGNSTNGPNNSSMVPPSIAIPSSKVNVSNIHLEIASLANSVSHHNPTRVLAASARQSLGSVRSLLGAPSTISQMSEDGDTDSQQELTDKAVIVIKRVMDKLTGLDFPNENSSTIPTQTPNATPNTHENQQQQQALQVAEQVDRLIREAISNENLSQSFFGWCPFW